MRVIALVSGVACLFCLGGSIDGAQLPPFTVRISQCLSL